MTYTYETCGTCSRFIDIEMDGDVVKNVEFTGGCNGNLQAISRLVKGMRYEQLKELVGGIRCGLKETSCADQLVKGIEEAMSFAAESSDPSESLAEGSL